MRISETHVLMCMFAYTYMRIDTKYDAWCAYAHMRI